jgi:hypothetical protein
VICAGKKEGEGVARGSLVNRLRWITSGNFFYKRQIDTNSREAILAI